MNWIMGAALAVAAIVAPVQQAERITASAGGISIEKPEGWQVIPPAESIENIRQFSFDSPEFQRAVQAADSPLITISKFPQPADGILPTIKIDYRHMPDYRGRGALWLVNGFLEGLRDRLDGFRVLDAAHDTSIAGQPAATMRISYQLAGDNGTSNIISELWIVQRGNYIYMIGVGYSVGAPSAVRREILAAVDSVRIEAE